MQRSSPFKVRIGDSNDLSFPVDELQCCRGGGRGRVKKGLPWKREETVFLLEEKVTTCQP